MCMRVIKWRNSVMTGYINFELLGNNKGNNHKGNISMLPQLLKLPPPHYYYHTTPFTIMGEGIELNQKTLCAFTLSKERISRIDLGIKLEISENA